ncbi:MAG: DUF2079 domain-containing protein [Halobacteriovoraceae bacterium]|nr:DUF2079 domain-containing protein [Halobacteriovoraceae bacterium]
MKPKKLSFFKQYLFETSWGGLLFFAIFLILAGNLFRVFHNCFNNYDLGIYHQAILELGKGDLNPYLTVRNIKIFNDHFDPVIFLAAFFVRLFGNAPEGTIIFEFLWYLGFLFLLAISIYKNNLVEKNWKIKTILLIIWMAVYPKGLLSGLIYPVHPTVWSIVPLFFICKYVKEQNFKGLILSSIALCFFKEIFPPALIIFSFYYALRKNRPYFFSLFSIGIMGTFFCFYLRPLWFGEIYPYNQIIFSADSFGQWFSKTFLKRSHTGIFKLLYPFIIPFYLLYKEEIKKEGFKHFSIPLLFLILPLLGLHFIAGKFFFHYKALIVGPLLAILSLSSIPQIIVKNKKILFFVCVLFFANGFSTIYKHQLDIVVRTSEDFIGTNYMERWLGTYERCSLTKGNRKTTEKIQKILDQKAQGKKILSSGGIIPRIIVPGRRVYHLGGHSKVQPYYDFILLGVNDSEDGYPMTREEIIKIKSSCGKFARKIHMDNNYYYLASGRFPSTCFKKGI